MTSYRRWFWTTGSFTLPFLLTIAIASAAATPRQAAGPAAPIALTHANVVEHSLCIHDPWGTRTSNPSQ